jgi:hypothetical protein
MKASWEEYQQVWSELRVTESSVQWARGELALCVIADYGEQSLAKFAESVGSKPARMYEYRSVAAKFPPEVRQEYNLPWYAFRLAASTPNPAAWLNRANDEHWSTSRLRMEIKGGWSAKEEARQKAEAIRRALADLAGWAAKQEPADRVACRLLLAGLGEYAAGLCATFPAPETPAPHPFCSGTTAVESR